MKIKKIKNYLNENHSRVFKIKLNEVYDLLYMTMNTDRVVQFTTMNNDTGNIKLWYDDNVPKEFIAIINDKLIGAS